MMHGHARGTIFLAVACGLWACRSGEREPTRVKPVEQRAVSAPTPPPQAVVNAAAPAPAAAPASSDGAPEWDTVRLEDEVPLCVFANYGERTKAPFLKDVRKQTLTADSRLVFGTFAPGCLNEACDAVPTLQCWVDSEPEPNTLVVHSRLSLKHKRGTACTKDCRPVMAGCETDVLKAGKYTVKYGMRAFSLRVPNVMRAPCLELQRDARTVGSH
jgi:hypothetical protein